MPCTETYKEHIMYTFNGFCKTVIRYAAINAWRDRNRQPIMPIEVFFCPSKDKLAFDRYQVRSSQGIRRYWLLMSLAHLVACTGCGEAMSFEDAMLIFIAISRKNGSVSFISVGQSTSLLRKSWL